MISIPMVGGQTGLPVKTATQSPNIKTLTINTSPDADDETTTPAKAFKPVAANDSPKRLENKDFGEIYQAAVAAEATVVGQSAPRNAPPVTDINAGKEASGIQAMVQKGVANSNGPTIVPTDTPEIIPRQAQPAAVKEASGIQAVVQKGVANNNGPTIVPTDTPEIIPRQAQSAAVKAAAVKGSANGEETFPAGGAEKPVTSVSTKLSEVAPPEAAPPAAMPGKTAAQPAADHSPVDMQVTAGEDVEVVRVETGAPQNIEADTFARVSSRVPNTLSTSPSPNVQAPNVQELAAQPSAAPSQRAQSATEQFQAYTENQRIILTHNKFGHTPLPAAVGPARQKAVPPPPTPSGTEAFAKAVNEAGRLTAEVRQTPPLAAATGAVETGIAGAVLVENGAGTAVEKSANLAGARHVFPARTGVSSGGTKGAEGSNQNISQVFSGDNRLFAEAVAAAYETLPPEVSKPLEHEPRGGNGFTGKVAAAEGIAARAISLPNAGQPAAVGSAAARATGDVSAVEQVKKAVEQAKLRGVQVLEMDLRPAQLGRIRLRLIRAAVPAGEINSLNAGKLRVEITAARAEGHALLSRHLGELQHTLNGWDVRLATAPVLRGGENGGAAFNVDNFQSARFLQHSFTGQDGRRGSYSTPDEHGSGRHAGQGPEDSEAAYTGFGERLVQAAVL